MTAMFVSYNSKSYHSAGRLRDQLAISRNLVDNRLCLYCPGYSDIPERDGVIFSVDPTAQSRTR